MNFRWFKENAIMVYLNSRFSIQYNIDTIRTGVKNSTWKFIYKQIFWWRESILWLFWFNLRNEFRHIWRHLKRDARDPHRKIYKFILNIYIILIIYNINTTI